MCASPSEPFSFHLSCPSHLKCLRSFLLTWHAFLTRYALGQPLSLKCVPGSPLGAFNITDIRDIYGDLRCTGAAGVRWMIFNKVGTPLGREEGQRTQETQKKGEWNASGMERVKEERGRGHWRGRRDASLESAEAF